MCTVISKSEVLLRSSHSVLITILEGGTIITPFYRRGDWGCARSGNLPVRVSQVGVVMVWPGDTAKMKYALLFQKVATKKKKKKKSLGMTVVREHWNMAKTLKNFRQLAYVISDTVTSSFSIFPPSSSPLPHLYLFLPVFPFLALLPHTIIVPLHVSFSYYLTYLTSKFSSERCKSTLTGYLHYGYGAVEHFLRTSESS